jgi:hypothetical protein
MAQEDNTKEKEANVSTKDTSNTGLWITSIWKLCRSLALTIAGCTLVYLVCKWLIGK